MNIVIVISGLHGTGKTTFARILSKKFGLRHVSAGGLFRKIAFERGLSISELSAIALEDKDIDAEIDERTRREAERGSVILDGLLAGWIAGEEANLRIFLTAPKRVRLKRISSRESISYDAARRATELRENSERRRFNSIYGIDIANTSIYDLILNTGLLRLEGNVEVIECFIKEYLEEYGRE